MKTKLLKLDKGPGFALLLTLVFLAAMLLVIAAMVNWSSTNAKITARNNQFVASQLAAEAATEVVAAQILRDYYDQGTNNASAWAAINVTNLNAWTSNITYQITDTNGTVNRVSVLPLASRTNIINNMMNIVQPYMLTATATPLGQLYNVPATISQTLDLNTIPIFQFVIFYNLNMEMDPSGDMPIAGNVHCNKSIWSVSTHVTYSNIVEAASQIYQSPSNNPFTTPGNPYKTQCNGAGPSVYKMAGQPKSGVPVIKLPITGTVTAVTDDSACYEILRWPSDPTVQPGADGAYTTDGQTYLVNKSDLIISNAVYGTNGVCGRTNSAPTTNFFVYYHDKDNSPRVKQVANDFFIVTNLNSLNSRIYTNNLPAGVLGPKTNLLYVGFTFLTNVVFYDFREGSSGTIGGTPTYRGKRIEGIEFNVGLFNQWLNAGGSNYNAICKDPAAHKGHSIGGIYIESSVPLTSTVLPAVRIVNGDQLYDSYGFSLATPLPLYLKGSFNVRDAGGICSRPNSTDHTQPAAFYADAITCLSKNFNDASNNLVNTAAVDTTNNAACLEGIVPSAPSLNSSSSDYGYSGGTENFLRLLENWSGKNYYYNGSIVVMFRSQMATNVFKGIGGYYNLSARPWSFNTNFLNPDLLPPMTPMVQTIVREGWQH